MNGAPGIQLLNPSSMSQACNTTARKWSLGVDIQEMSMMLLARMGLGGAEEEKAFSKEESARQPMDGGHTVQQHT
jgi:hypothetical protein